MHNVFCSEVRFGANRITACVDMAVRFGPLQGLIGNAPSNILKASSECNRQYK